MAEKKKTFKEYTVNVKSVGTRIGFDGESIILNNGIPQTKLKAMYGKGIKAITKNIKPSK